jgi:hypothetical protein
MSSLTDKLSPDVPGEQESADLCIICEGDADQVILSKLVKRLLAENSLAYDVRILTAYGKLVIPRIVRAAERHLQPKALAVVINSTGNLSKVLKDFRKELDLDKYWVIIAKPNVESWVTNGGGNGIDDVEQFVKLAGKADLGQIESAHPEFHTLKQAVTNIHLPQ